MSDFKIIPSLFGANISKLKEEVMPLKKQVLKLFM